jgi:hypothetical protein
METEAVLFLRHNLEVAWIGEEAGHRQRSGMEELFD